MKKLFTAVCLLIVCSLAAQDGQRFPTYPVKVALADTDYFLINKSDSVETAIIQFKYLKAAVTGGIKDTTPSTGNTVVITSGYPTLYVHGTGTLSALTIKLPQSPLNGQIFTVIGDQSITSLTVTGGTLVTAISSFNPSSPLRLIYDTAQTKWANR